ncbi:hypothetical protein [Nemorincola caseinilytica]|uniref:hypothetical protein n=1 Tax=Nemorincola caseinilytica TaxID=2054315 RepID=UPI0031EAD339
MDNGISSVQAKMTIRETCSPADRTRGISFQNTAGQKGCGKLSVRSMFHTIMGMVSRKQFNRYFFIRKKR